MTSIFISHGSPMLALANDSNAQFLRNLSSQFPKPKAIVIFSAHFETVVPTITGSQNPKMIYDFYGFPQELYELKYPALGDPELAATIKSLLNNSEIDFERGIDHGVWSPLLLMYPKADIPVVEISIQPNQDARYHYQLGKILGALREENILIIGTGNLTHNLREAMLGHQEVPNWVTEFSDWFANCLAKNNIEDLLNWKKLAPYATRNHPTPEHLLPFFVALGAASNPANFKRLNENVALGVLAMDTYLFSD